MLKRKIVGGKIALLALLLILLFTACAPAALPANGTEDIPVYTFHTELQRAYLADKAGNVARYAGGTAELSRPEAVVLELSDLSEEFAYLEVSEDPSFEDSFTLLITQKKAEIYNCKIDTTYYYRAVKEGGETSDVSSFRTENVAPRNLYIDGVTNARDLGGYSTPFGKVRQGLLFRTARLNKNKTVTPTPIISEEGIRTMKEFLKVRTEVDLRKNSDNEIGSLTASVLGDGVTYHNLPMTASSDMVTANGESLKRLFSLLADENNYPLFFHCSIGTDRTGYTAFLILTLLGVDNAAIYRDYLFSNFGNIGSNRTTMNVMGFSLFLATQKGNNPREQAEYYLFSIGVTPKEISSFRRIMIEPR